MKKILLTMALAVAMLPSMGQNYNAPTDIVVTVNGFETPSTNTISAEKQADGTYNFTLQNFRFAMGGQTLPLGNIELKNVPAVQQDGVVYLNTTKQNVRLGGVFGAALGNIPVTLRGELRDNATKLYASMDIDVSKDMNVTVILGHGYQLPNSGFEDYQNYTENLVFGGGETTVQEAIGWHSFASAKGDYQQAATAFANPYTWKSSIVRPGSTGKSSLMITSSNVFGVVANGTVTTGRMNCGAMIASNTDNHAEMEINDSVDAHGDPYYAEINGQPDSLVVWYAFKQGTPTADHPYATVNAVITDGTYYQDPENTTYNNKRSQAQDNKIPTTFTNGTPVWKRLAIPFNIIDKDVKAKAILVTISTNADPGAGSIDTLYVDDINLVYNAPTNINIDWGNPTDTVKTSDITVTYDGALGAKVVESFVQNGDDVDVTVDVYSGDLSQKVAEEKHTYLNTVTGIKKVTLDNTSLQNAEVFDLSGRRVNSTVHGNVYILKTADGKTVKVIK